jgi:cytochrome oxidase Cu insertion factor (SCO1/SenC/PrrC family)
MKAAMSGRAALRATAAAQRRRRRRGRVLLRLALALVGAGLMLAAAWTWQETRPRATLPLGPALPPLTLVDDAGQPITRASWAGHAVVFSLAFLHDVGRAAPALDEMRALAAAVPKGALAGRVALVTVSLAPEEDTPDHLRAFAVGAGVTPPWSLVSGAPAEVVTLLEALEVDWRRLQRERARYGSPIFPDERLILVDGTGRLRDEYDARSWTAMRRLRSELAALVAPAPR